MATSIRSTIVLLACCLLSFVTASHNITAVPIDGCSAYPGYDATSGGSGNFYLQAYQTDNSSVDGIGSSLQYSRGATQIRWGMITLGVRVDEAKVVLRCYDQVLHGFVATGVSGYTWETLQFAPYPYDQELMYLVDGGPAAQAHTLSVDGVEQEGVFLGADGVALWGFRYIDASQGCCGVPYYQLRLLGPNSADPNTGAPLQDGEFTGFLKIAAF
ncbi:uncharacterized protein PV09_00481 [Verruconis gallopava]|uniref:Ubiquitin 3 binding protein But2 C-terminal domain-containing protein n=1 Tax=Verruconis gallopava TaxID=253628 RepID=A0A0D2ASD1_9PEZI|nr:uncharacterized protein PV09_00481 [Verruconis gallopava]KIW09613.1 hypothetical protein PV09_00481 [Verruconis gallopava]